MKKCVLIRQTENNAIGLFNDFFKKNKDDRFKINLKSLFIVFRYSYLYIFIQIFQNFSIYVASHAYWLSLSSDMSIIS